MQNSDLGELACATGCPMRSVVLSSGGMMRESPAKGLLHITPINQFA